MWCQRLSIWFALQNMDAAVFRNSARSQGSEGRGCGYNFDGGAKSAPSFQLNFTGDIQGAEFSRIYAALLIPPLKFRVKLRFTPENLSHLHLLHRDE